MAGDDGDQVQIGVVAQGVGEQLGDLGRPQVLVLQVDQAAGPPDRLAVAAGDAAFAVRREGVDAVRVGIGAQHLDGCGPPGGSAASGQRVGRAGPRRAAGPAAGHRVLRVQRRRIVPPFPEGGVQRADDRAADRQLHVVPRRVRAVRGAHAHRLGVTVVGRVVAAAVAQVDAADERDVASRRARVPEHHQLLVVRAAAADPLVEQHLAAGPLDRLAEVLVLLLAEREPVQVRAPHQALDHHAPLGGGAEQIPATVGPPGRSQLVGVAAPVGEEQVVAAPQRFDLGDEPIEVGGAVHQRLHHVALAPGGQRTGRVTPLRCRKEPVLDPATSLLR